MSLESVKGNLKSLEEQKQAIVVRLDRIEKRIEDLKEQLNKLENKDG